jgi:O-acetylhomoserine/O-acetylserine sulfhydrylase-like pyridoxal-dependent enzyme
LDISPLGSSIQNYFEYEIDPFNYAVQSTIYTSSNTSYSGDDGKALSGAVIDGGKNEASSYDIDMTRNDLGTYGGPYSMENYWDSTATGKARIYHLDMPSEIWPGQTPTIKASAVHKK